MKTTYWQIIFVLGIILSCLFSSCRQDRIINVSEILLDSTNYYIFKETGEKVMGLVRGVKYDKSGDTLFILEYKIKDGIAEEGIQYYYPGGQVQAKFEMSPVYRNEVMKLESFLPTGELDLVQEFAMINNVMRLKNQTVYHDSVKEYTTMDYEKEIQNKKVYVHGKQVMEVIHNLAGQFLRAYDIDDNGNKIIPAIEKLEVVVCETGFYSKIDYEKRKVRYVPMVILKIKNITSEILSGNVLVQGIFVRNDEELSTNYSYFQNEYDPPLRSGVARQVDISCDVSWNRIDKLKEGEVKCQIFIDNNPYKIVDIKNKILTSNRIQD